MVAPDTNANKKLAAIKITVYSLGFLLIGGVVLLSALIVQRNKNQPVPVNTAPPATTCVEGETEIKTKSPIDKIIKDTTTLTLLTYETDEDSQQIIIVDLCTGKVKRSMLITR